MANEEICVFCGEKLQKFRSTEIPCGPTWQPACKTCGKEIEELPELDRCRRALVRGVARDPERLRGRIELITEAEDHRPQCDHCATGLTFLPVQSLDNSPYRDSMLSEPFEVLPAYCGTCGRYTFFNPTVTRKNRFLAYLVRKDTRD